MGGSQALVQQNLPLHGSGKPVLPAGRFFSPVLNRLLQQSLPEVVSFIDII